MQYKIIVTSNEQVHTAKKELEEEVRIAITDGWKPQGGVSMCFNPNFRIFFLSQALER